MTELYEPELKDLWFRQRFMADEETMSYNRAWGGTIPFPESAWKAWYDRWLVHHGNRRFYRYLREDATGEFVGEVAYHEDGRGIFLADVIVEAGRRGHGYGTEGLKLLCAAAYAHGIDELWDEVAEDNPAVGIFLKAGFRQVHCKDGIITLRKDLRTAPRRIIVIGSPGSGKSTFARRLRDRTGLPLYYLDMMFHRPDGTSVSGEEFDGKLARVLEGREWIIDGNYQRTLGRRFETCTEVFLFDLPVQQCLEGAASRIGKAREDMPWIEKEFDPDFRQFILDFPENQLPKIRKLTQQYQDTRTITVFHAREEADAYLRWLFP